KESKMKIAITAKGKDLESELDPRFGRAQNYIFYDTELKTFKALSNENIEASGGAGTAAAQIMSKEGIEAVISGNFGPNASLGLKAINIKMFTSGTRVVKNIIEDFLAGKLTEVGEATVPGHQN
ncbi:MAG: dinitrogenase iron-molybdenum cofactor biosynthesis protein, partial [Candidatus Margulisbacteria bacterium]|nr:dinitrogenase iron-molybdenum cofactor biosynthesis protein [Candidatus Margulisiibacteriota bacterium]